MNSGYYGVDIGVGTAATGYLGGDDEDEGAGFSNGSVCVGYEDVFSEKRRGVL